MHLAGMQEAPPRLSCPETGRCRTSQPVCHPSVRLGDLSAGTERITLEELRTVLGLDSVKDADGNVIREARLAAWANFRNRALYTAISEINRKTDLNISLESLEQAEHGRVTALTLTIKAQAAAKGKPIAARF
jgi:hypothetical protein